MKSKITISILLLSILAVTGCVSQSLEEAQVDFCQALVAYGDAVQDLQNVIVSTTVDELQTARDNVFCFQCQLQKGLLVLSELDPKTANVSNGNCIVRRVCCNVLEKITHATIVLHGHFTDPQHVRGASLALESMSKQTTHQK